MDIALVALSTFAGSGIGTLTGFGTSTIMVPVMASFFPLSQALLFVGIIHWFGDIWKMVLFREGIRWELILGFGVPGIVATVLGSVLIFRVPETLLSRVLGAVLLCHVAFVLVRGRLKVPETTLTAVAGGALSGFTAGIFGIGGAMRGAFLSAFDLPKAVYIATGGAIGLVIDTGRLVTYWWHGAQVDPRLLWGLLLFIPVSFLGARGAERTVERVPQHRFQAVIAASRCLVGLKLLLFPSE